MTSSTDPTSRTAGYTLAELLIVVTVSGIIMAIAVRGWGPMLDATLSLKARAGASADLRVTVGSLLEDLGCADQVIRTGEGGVWIIREEACARALGAWNGSDDPGVLWTFESEVLRRHDLASTANIMIAPLSAFDVTETEELISVRIAVGEGLDASEMTLQWTL